ncbi:GNAT family N-acetyltransferase [Streptomyces harbinensis]|uniref:GNAT family N-acetyltransferase n=1 Tax=Streptomyces harbinensis TaxID=1176198 RepID=UPI00158FBD01|nr:GNAT family N-acetyltransferase [Streptomyces harbinensis]QKV70896.1 GNAT family N-acetyltransferase [Streptomyces harbinensis]
MTDTPDVTLRRAGTEDFPVVERLWLMFRHDLSGFRGELPAPDGTFRADRLHAAFRDPGRAAYLTLSGDRPAGFVFVRALDTPVRVLNAFFVVRGARRAGVGTAAVREVVARHPGRWEIPFQEANRTGARFWRRVAGELAGPEWTEERRPVPGRPDVPPDHWIGFTAGPWPLREGSGHRPAQ